MSESKRTTYQGDVIGWGPTRARWYSFCSKMSHGHASECPACMAGSYRNDFAHRGAGLVWKHARPLALWWHNRPNARARRDIERHFPRCGLRWDAR